MWSDSIILFRNFLHNYISLTPLVELFMILPILTSELVNKYVIIRNIVIIEQENSQIFVCNFQCINLLVNWYWFSYKTPGWSFWLSYWSVYNLICISLEWLVIQGKRKFKLWQFLLINYKLGIGLNLFVAHLLQC